MHKVEGITFTTAEIMKSIETIKRQAQLKRELILESIHPLNRESFSQDIIAMEKRIEELQEIIEA